MRSTGIDERAFEVRPTAARVSDDALTVELEDGRTLTNPLVWYPRLMHGTPSERANMELSPFGIHWPDLDEDVSIKGMILGWKSEENPASLKFWLDNRAKDKRVTFEDFMRRRKHKPGKQPARKKTA
jgi:hypothetical protein